MDEDSVREYAQQLVQELLKSCLDRVAGDPSWPNGAHFSPEAAQDCIEQLVQVSETHRSSFINSLLATELACRRELEALHRLSRRAR